MTVYDVHAHCLPTGLLERLERDGPGATGVEVVVGERGRALRYTAGPTIGVPDTGLTDVEARLASMDDAGVDVQLVSPWVGATGYYLPGEMGAAWARLFNEHLAGMVADHPERFRGLGTVPLQDGLAASEELAHAVVTLGLAGIEICASAPGRELDDPDLEPLWTTAAALRCPVLIHPDRALEGRGVNRYYLENLVGNPAESTIAVAHLVFGGVLERHPDLRVIVVHGGGFVPWQAGRWDRGFDVAPRIAGERISTRPSELVRRLWFDSILHDVSTLGRLIDWAGAQRVVLGSDYPFDMGDRTPLATLDAVAGLSADARYAITGGNVERLLAEVRR